MYAYALPQQSTTVKGVLFLCHMKLLGKYWRLCISYFIAIVFLFASTIISYADINDLMIGSGSNALMTMELDDSDYSVMPMSSLGSISNTIGSDRLSVSIPFTDGSGTRYGHAWAQYNGSSYDLDFSVSDSYSITGFMINLYSADLPNAGSYSLSYDYSSDISHSYESFALNSMKTYTNAASVTSVLWPVFDQVSGDLFLDSYKINLTNLYRLQVGSYIPASEGIREIHGSFKINFTSISSGDYPSTAGTNTTNEDYQSGVSSSLSDLSSSVDTMTDEISGVTEAIQNLQGAMEPHYSNVLTQLHHITEQLHAFYDQVYNNIHLPELDMLTQIRNAIENIDLQIEVDISEVKTAINNMSQAVQNKLQSTTDQVTNGYDNSGIVQENEKLEQSINDYDMVESEIFDEAGGFVGEFEYPSIDSLSGSVIKALAFVGSFLQSIFLSMGDFSSIITFSLTMIFVMVVVGYHRIRS